MNVEIGTEAALFPEKEYISRIFVSVQYCSSPSHIPGAKGYKEMSSILADQ